MTSAKRFSVKGLCRKSVNHPLEGDLCKFTLEGVKCLIRITVCTADIIDLRQQDAFSRELAGKLSALKDLSLLSPFRLSRGDEIQGVLSGWLSSPAVIRKLRFTVRPLKLRIGLGWGEISPDEILQNPWDRNGPAFFRARQALDSLKKYKLPVTALLSGNEPLDDIANSILSLLDAIQRSWTARQWEAVQAYEQFATFEAAAERLGIKPQNVQKHCRKANWAEVRKAEQTLSRLAGYFVAEEHHFTP